MADTPTFQSNPYGSFDPSQWSNPYSQFYGKALPWPSSYAGTPNNALGQPIATPPGMTLNSSPAAAPQAPAANQGQWAMNNAMLNSMGQAASAGGPSPQMSNVINMRAQNNAMYGAQPGPGGSVPTAASFAAQGAPQAAAAPPNNWQQTLGMLANPGQVTTPGATVPQAASSAQPDPGVLQSFLANWKPQQSGPGSGFTQNFNTILRGLQAQKGS